MITLDKNNIPLLIKGASLFTTGGGFPYADQMQLVGATMQKYPGFQVILKDVAEMDPEDYLATIAEIGPADAPEIEKEPIIKKVVSAFEAITGKTLKGLCPLELGVEAVTLHTAYFSGLPLLDCDFVGGRAVPLVGIDSFAALGLTFPVTPCAVGTDKNEVLILASDMSNERAEDVLRHLAALSDSKAVVAIFGLVQVKYILNTGIVNHAYSQSLEFGEIKDFAQLKNRLKPKLVLDLEIISRLEMNRQGFNCLGFTGRDAVTGLTYKISVLNEVLFLLNDKNEIVAEIPDRILAIDPVALQGIHTKDFMTGKKITFLVIESEAPWQTKKAREIFGRDRFQYLIDDTIKHCL